jgi:hypothetical protein
VRNVAVLYCIAHRRYRNLSRGAFTDDNHQKLAGPKSGIPIYRAWVLGDTRLVYYIDCIDDVAGSVSWQDLFHVD